MKTEDFEELLEYRLEEIRTVLGKKAKEYSTEDRLHNFKVAANISNCSQAKALWGMAMKHLVSVIDIVEAVRPYDTDTIDEKIGDMINYLILLEAVLKEEL